MLAALPLSGPVIAADSTEPASATANPQVIEEVLVNARRTAENLQQVPIAVTALTPTDLQQQNIVRGTDLMYAVPSLTVAPLFNTLYNFYSIRGLPTGTTTYFAESACCTGSAAMPFMDVASVQVLNGPQGTLFGRTSAAGSVLIEPARPDLNETDAYLQFRFGDYNRREFTGTVNVPLIADTLALRFAANVNHVEGYTSQIGSSTKLDEQENQQFRLGVQFENERFTNYTAINYLHMDQSATNQVLVQSNTDVFPYNVTPDIAPFIYGAPCVGAVSIGLNPDVDSCVAQRQQMVEGMTAAFIAEQSRIDNGGDSAIRRSPGPINGQPQFLKIKDWSILNVAEFDGMEFGQVDISVKDVFSYEWLADNTANYVDGIGGRAQQSGGFNTYGGSGGNNTRDGKATTAFGGYHTTLNNDLNLHFDVADGLFTAVLGFYYSRTDSPSSNDGVSNIYQLWSGVLQPGLEYQSAADFNEEWEASERAWYTQATLDLSRFGAQGLSFTAGYRKSWDKSHIAGLAPVFDPVTGSYAPGQTLNETRDESDGYNYLFTLTEQFTDDFMVYLSNTRAYVPGGINAVSSDPSIADLPNYSPTYGPEIVTAWEVGAKIDFRLADAIPARLNGAIYQYDFDNIGVVFSGITSTGAAVSYLANAAAAELKGFELSGAILPFDGLEISFAYNYNDASYKDWIASDPLNIAQPGDPLCSAASDARNCLLDLSGQSFQRMPEHQGHITAAYTLPIDPSLGNMVLSATVYAQSLVWFSANAERELSVNPGAKPSLSQEGYERLNLRADWTNVIDSGFDAAIFITNATDEVYKLSTTNQLLTLGFAVATYGPPRMWGFEISKQF